MMSRKAIRSGVDRRMKVDGSGDVASGFKVGADEAGGAVGS
jgi:hypothetical protein